MNYFINSYYTAIFIATIIINTGLLILFLFFVARFIDHFNIRDFWKTLMVIASIFVYLAVFITIFMFVHDKLNDGKINKIYILKSDNESRLVVWLTRMDTPEISLDDVFSHKIKSFDLEKGKKLGQIDPVRRYTLNDYRIFGPFDENKAWGYGHTTGVQLLDLFAPKVLVKEKEILGRNPQLGQNLQLVPGDYHYIYDSTTHDLHVMTPAGKFYKITPGLEALPAGNIHLQIPYYPPHWLIERVEGSWGLAAHAKDSQLSANRAVFLSPEIVKEWDEALQAKDKAWVLHRSSLKPDADFLLSYVDANGEEISRINLSRLFKKRKAQAYRTLTREDDIFVFVTCEKFTLSALHTDRQTGAIKKRIDYFQ
jgi:hypothetical protein